MSLLTGVSAELALGVESASGYLTGLQNSVEILSSAFVTPLEDEMGQF